VVVSGRFRGLDESSPTGFFDRSEAERAVGSGPREHDPNGIVSLIGGQGPEEMVDRGAAKNLAGLAHLEDSVLDAKPHAGRNDVSVTVLHASAILGLLQRQGGRMLKDLRQIALPAVTQMEHHDDGDARLARHRLQKFSKCIHPPGRRPNADNRLRRLLGPGGAVGRGGFGDRLGRRDV